MAAHSVKMLVEHPLNVGNLGVEFEIRRGGKLLGKLQISQTSVDWTPAKARNPRKASWQEFGDWMESKGARRNGTVGREPARGRPEDGPGSPEVSAAVDILGVEDEPGRGDGPAEADTAEVAEVADAADTGDVGEAREGLF